MIFIILSTTFLTNLMQINEAADCFPNYCHQKTSLGNDSNVKCFIESLQKTEDCAGLSFENFGHFPPVGKEFAKIQLTAYVKKDNLNNKVTAFNLSVSDSNFRKFLTRYQSVGDEKVSECRRVEFFSNFSFHSNLFISCSLENETHETSPYRLEYLVSTDEYEYSRKLVFIVPRHKFIDPENDDVKSFVPFIYVDVSDTSELSLYIQPTPAKFKVNSYRIWLINNGTRVVKNVTVASFDGMPIRYNFQVESGVYYFKVASLHNNCNIYGCVNSTSPLISIKHSSHRLLIMIISVIWIPPVIFYALFNAYKVYRKNEKLKRAERKPKCLIVYQPTHTLHVNVILDLARYLRGCNIHAIIDILDLPESTNKDPALWYNEMFYKADIILWAASPPPSDGFVPSFTENVEKQILRLSQDYHTRRLKKFYILHLPYCSITDLPQEADVLKVFTLPEELNKLVKTINNVDYIRFFGVSSKLLVESINSATIELAQEHSKLAKHSERNDIPLLMEKSLKPNEKINDTEIGSNECDGNFSPTKKTVEQLKLLNEN